MVYQSNANCSSPRIRNYLNGLRDQFEQLSSLTKTSGPRPFDSYLGYLEHEFELMVQKIESLQKERDEMVKAQTKNCERCNGTISFPQRTKKATRTSSFFRPFFRFKSKSPGSPNTSYALRDVNLGQEMATRPPTFYFVATPTQPFHTTRSLGIHSQAVAFPSAYTTVDPDSSSKNRRWSITFATKELDVGILHELYQGKPIFCVCFSQDGKYLAAGCEDGKASIYDVETGKLTCFLKKSLARNHINSSCRDETPADGSSDGSIKDRINAVCFSRDGKYLATGSSDGSIYIWEISKRFVRNAFKGDRRFVHSLHFSPNGRLLVSAYDNSIRLWNVRDGAGFFLTGDDPKFLDDPCYSSTVFSPDGRYIAASHRDGMVRIWDVRTGQLMRRVNAHMGRAYGVVFMPDRKGLVSGGKDMALKYWDISTLYTTQLRGSSQTRNRSGSHVSAVEEQKRPKRRFSGHKDSVCSLAISPDGRWVASGSYDKSVRIWDTDTATTQCIIDNVHKIAGTVDFSPAGHYLASAGFDGVVRIWKYSYTTPASGGS